jgi:hypothetical protein
MKATPIGGTDSLLRTGNRSGCGAEHCGEINRQNFGTSNFSPNIMVDYFTAHERKARQTSKYTR